jgi:hypothetical protein
MKYWNFLFTGVGFALAFSAIFFMFIFYVRIKTIQDENRDVSQIKRSNFVRFSPIICAIAVLTGLFFLIASKDLPKEYKIKSNGMYFMESRIFNADSLSFQYVGDFYSKDKRRVYYKNKAVEDVDPADCTKENLKGCEAPK